MGLGGESNQSTDNVSENIAHNEMLNSVTGESQETAVEVEEVKLKKSPTNCFKTANSEDEDDEDKDEEEEEEENELEAARLMLGVAQDRLHNFSCV